MVKAGWKPDEKRLALCSYRSVDLAAEHLIQAGKRTESGRIHIVPGAVRGSLKRRHFCVFIKPDGSNIDHRHADMLGGAMVAGFGLGHRQMDGATHERDSVAERMIMGRNPAGKRER